jgi:Sulfotransferase family
MTRKAPVFVLGCPRSGTTLLYHMLLSAGDFAVYRAETHVFNLLVPRFGNLRHLASRTHLIDQWLTTDYFRRAGVDADSLRQRVLGECHNGGDFLRIVMESIAAQQGVSRWAECTPEHLLYLEDIRRTIPEARIIHIIRDGRDVALSLEKQGWIRPLPGDSHRSLGIAALYWEWIVRRGRQAGRRLAPHYLEVRFEELVATPQKVLDVVGEFIEQELNYEQIVKASVGSVGDPNTSFSSVSPEADFNPVGRWRNLPQHDIDELEDLIGTTLRELAYPLTHGETARPDLASTMLRWRYRSLFAIKHWLKSRTSLGRFVNTSLLYQPIGSEMRQV